MPVDAVYTAQATATHGRSGQARTSTGSVDVRLSPPPEMGGDGGEGTNPEELFATGFAACFSSAMDIIASKQRLPIEGASVTVRVGIGPDGSGSFGLAVEIDASMPGVPREAAERVIQRAEKVCPYSKAVQGNIPVTVRLVEAAPAG